MPVKQQTKTMVRFGTVLKLGEVSSTGKPISFCVLFLCFSVCMCVRVSAFVWFSARMRVLVHVRVYVCVPVHSVFFFLNQTEM